MMKPKTTLDEHGFLVALQCRDGGYRVDREDGFEVYDDHESLVKRYVIIGVLNPGSIGLTFVIVNRGGGDESSCTTNAASTSTAKEMSCGATIR